MIISVSEITKILHINNLASSGTAVMTSIQVDSRLVTAGTLFIALKGNHHDGRNFTEDAFKNGAKAAIINDNNDGFELLHKKELAIKYGCALFVVHNTLQALHTLAKWHLKKFPNIIKIAITGSSGKTTVKNLLYSIFSQAYHTHATPGNLNSETGLPLSIFQIQGHHQVTILEMGMNRKGEIAELTSIVNPDYAIITNIGSAHIGYLESIEEIAAEKKAIFNCFTDKQTAFIPQHDAYAAFLAKGLKGKVLFYAPETIKRLSSVQSLGLDGWLLKLHNKNIHFHLPGDHNYENACLAIYVAKELNIKIHHIQQGLEAVRATEHRNEILKGAITVIKDCYNANPESMRAAIKTLAPLKYARKVAFLSEMKELGLGSIQAHKHLAKPILEANIQALFLLGKEMLFLEQELKLKGFNGIIFTNTHFDTLKSQLKIYLKPGDLLLIKGSRSYQLERLEPFLKENKLLSTVY